MSREVLGKHDRTKGVRRPGTLDHISPEILPLVTIYDRIGTTYTATRRPDARIAARIARALGDARTVVNVGAGAGSYEPPQTVLAVEPSTTPAPSPSNG